MNRTDDPLFRAMMKSVVKQFVERTRKIEFRIMQRLDSGLCLNITESGDDCDGTIDSNGNCKTCINAHRATKKQIAVDQGQGEAVAWELRQAKRGLYIFAGEKVVYRHKIAEQRVIKNLANRAS